MSIFRYSYVSTRYHLLFLPKCAAQLLQNDREMSTALQIGVYSWLVLKFKKVTLLAHVRPGYCHDNDMTWAHFPYYGHYRPFLRHYSDVIMGQMTSQITSIWTVCWPICSGAHQRKHQSTALLAFVRGIWRGFETSWCSCGVTVMASTWQYVRMLLHCCDQSWSSWHLQTSWRKISAKSSAASIMTRSIS